MEYLPSKMPEDLDASSPAPWQDLGPLPTIRINDEETAWIVYKIDHHEASGECSMTLVESLPPAYGQDYGAGWD